VNDVQAWVGAGEIVEDAWGGVGGAIVDGDNFELWVVNFEECG
jgi:hypothetical protein